MSSVMDRAAALVTQRQAVMTGDLPGEFPDIQLHRFSASERLSEPFELQMEVMTFAPADFGPHLGAAVGVQVNEDPTVSRLFTGRLFEARHLTGSDKGHTYELTVRPWFSLLGLNLNSRVFQAKSALDVVREVLGPYKHRVDASAKDDKIRDYCVQYRESDFAFVSRLLEEEGFYYFFEHKEGGEEMVICGGPSAHKPIAPVASAPFRDYGSGMREMSFWEWSERVAPVPSVVTLRDNHHLLLGAVESAPEKSERARAAGRGPAHQSELYDYPGSAGGLKDEGALADRNAKLAKVRLESARAEHRRFSGEGDAFAIACGAKLTLTEHPVADWNQDYLVLSAKHALAAQTYQSGHGGGEMLVQVEATPFATPWRPALRTPRPVVAGPTTAVVIGAAGETIDVDAHGRVLVKFNWDRRAGVAPELGVRLRVSQGWAGGGYGFQNIPRIGTEVIIDFVDGDPDLPMITGRLHSKTLKPPLDLPANKTRSTWKSQTVGKSGSYDAAEEPPSGVGFNEIRLEDKGGSEEVYIHAQRLRSDWTRLDEKKKVGRDLVERIGRDRKTEVKRHETVVIEEGDETRTLKKGSRKTVIKKADSLTLNTGDSTTTVEKGNLEVKVSKGKIEISAKQKIVLKVGGSKITLTPSGIDVEAGIINVKAKSMMTVQGAMTTVKASGILTAEGKLVMIN